MSILEKSGSTGPIVKFSPVFGDETTLKFGVSKTVKGLYHCINFMNEYKTKSLEELRFEDYIEGRKGPKAILSGQFSAKAPPSNFGNFLIGSSVFSTPVSTSGEFAMSTDPGNFIPSANPVTPSFSPTSGGFGMTSQPVETGLFSRPGAGFFTPTTTSSFGFNCNASSSSFSTSSPIKPFGITSSNSTNEALTPFSTQSSFTGFGNTDTSNPFGIHQPEKTNNLFSIQQPANTNFFGTSTITPVFQSPKTAGFSFGVSTSTSPLDQSQQMPFGQTNISTSTSLIGSNTGSTVMNIEADMTGTDVKFVPVIGSSTLKINEVNQAIKTRFHCITCMQEYQTKSLEELRYEDYMKDRKGVQTSTTEYVASPTQSSIFERNTSSPSVFSSNDTLMSEDSGTTGERRTDFLNSLFTRFEISPTTANVSASHVISTVFLPRVKEITRKYSFQEFKKQAKAKKAEMKAKKSGKATITFTQKTNAEVQTAESSRNIECLNKKETALILPVSSTTEFGKFELTSTTNTTSVSGAKSLGIIGNENTNCVASSTSLMPINVSAETETATNNPISEVDKIQQLIEELNCLKLDVKQLKDEFKSNPPNSRRKSFLRTESDKDKLLQEEQKKNRRLTADIQKLKERNKTLNDLNIKLQKMLFKYFPQGEGYSTGIFKDLLNGNSFNLSNGDSTDLVNGDSTDLVNGDSTNLGNGYSTDPGNTDTSDLGNEDTSDLVNEDTSDLGNEESNDKDDSDTEEMNDEEETSKMKKSTLIVEQSPKFTITVEEDYKGPRLEDGKVTLKFMEELVKYYRKQGKLHRSYACKILLDVKTFFATQPSLIDIKIPDDGKFTICGDIHGQFYDLLNIFEINGSPSETNPYLFNGDVVDRGSFSVECIFTLFGYKLLYPNHFFIARGNHEAASMNEKYGFNDEVKSKYTSAIATLFTEVFNWLPLAHCLNNRVLVMHGGLFSRDDVTLDDIRKVKRNRQPPETGIMCELLWADPQSEPGREPSKRGGKRGLRFGPDVTNKFLENNNLEYIIRSHEFKQNGFDIDHNRKCITVFSAPNYCDHLGNKGAFIILNGKEMKCEFKVFDAVPHPIAMPIIQHVDKKTEIH